MGSSDINNNGDFFNTDTSDNGFSSSDSFFIERPPWRRMGEGTPRRLHFTMPGENCPYPRAPFFAARAGGGDLYFRRESAIIK